MTGDRDRSGQPPTIPPAPLASVTQDGPRPGLLNRVTALIAAAVAMLLLAGASRLPMTVHASDDAMLRLAWSARPERVESCRTATDEELANLPEHMRQRVICEGTTARYRLEIARDDRVLSSTVIRGGGLRHDRQLYVFDELRIPPGRAILTVTLTRLDDSAATPGAGAGASATAPGNDSGEMDDRAQRQMEEHQRRVADEVPARLSLSETLTLAPREVVLLTYDADDQRFRLLTRSGNP